jgi:hypothetical protein
LAASTQTQSALGAGRHTAANIQGARLKIIPSWGHDLPDAPLP